MPGYPSEQTTASPDQDNQRVVRLMSKTESENVSSAIVVSNFQGTRSMTFTLPGVRDARTIVVPKRAFSNDDFPTLG